jgi:hypothetical protein
VLEHTVGLKHPDVAHVPTILARLQAKRGPYAEAERLAQRAVGIMEQV